MRKCADCPARAESGRSCCRPCLDARAAVAKERRKERLASGMCPCGKAWLESGKRGCAACLALAREHQADLRRARREARAQERHGAEEHQEAAGAP